MRTTGKSRRIGKSLALLALLALLATACDGTNAPQLIAAYPQTALAQPWAALTPAEAERTVRDRAWEECEDAHWAAGRRGWNPALTARAASGVLLTVFQLVVDGLIWMVVVAGPLVLMGVGAAAVLRRLREGR